MLIGSRNNLRVLQFFYSYYCAITDVRNYTNPLHIDSDQSIHAMNGEKKNESGQAPPSLEWFYLQ